MITESYRGKHPAINYAIIDQFTAWSPGGRLINKFKSCVFIRIIIIIKIVIIIGDDQGILSSKHPAVSSDIIDSYTASSTDRGPI